MSPTDRLLLAATVFAGAMSLGYAVFRHGMEEEKRRVIRFWLEIFLLCALLLSVRLFYALFPGVSPEAFFFGCTVLAGGGYIYFKLTRLYDPPERQKTVRLCRDAFICLLFVFTLRGFFYDWFRIPSNSMLPTLTVGDLVLTDKSRYGMRLPLLNTRLTQGTPPQRGDVVVFRKPGEDLFYIKRIVALPGDTLRYTADKRLIVNDEVLPWREAGAIANTRHWREQFAGGWHSIYVDGGHNALFTAPAAQHCHLQQEEAQRGNTLTCTVPPQQYFVLGDNRDHSNDSRFWGFVPQEHIVGPATRVLLNHRLLTALEMHQWRRFWHSLALQPQ